MAEDPKVTSLRKQLALAKELERLERTGAEMSDEQANKALEHIAHYGSMKDAVRAINEELKESLRVAGTREAQLSRQLELLQKEQEILEGDNLTRAEQIELNENIIEQEKIKLELLKQQEVLDKEKIEDAKRLIKEKEKDNDELKNQSKGIGETIEKLKTAKGRAEVFGKVLNKGLGSASGAFNRMSKMISGTVIGGIKDLVFQFNNVTKAFDRATGLNQEFNDSMVQSFERGKAYGVSLKDSSDAHMALISSVNEFTMASEAERQAIGDTISMLNEFGMASADTAQAVQNSMAFFDQSLTEAANTMVELKGLANELQVMPAEMAAAYAKMGPELAKFGSEGISAFKELARVQKITGMEMEKVLRITAKFDTFEGAAEAAGSLNAALGANAVNAMDLLMETDPVARFEMIRDSILDAGLSFDSMSYYQKQFFAQAAGLDSVGDLALMLRGRMDLMSGATDQSAESYEEMAMQAQQLQTFQEQMQALLAENAPLFMKIAEAATNFLRALQEQENLLPKIIGLYISLKTASIAFALASTFLQAGMYKVSGGLAAVAAIAAIVGFIFFQQTFMSNFVQGIGKLAVAFFGLSTATKPASIGLRSIAASAIAAGPGLLMVGGAIALIGAGIGAAAFGMSMLVDAFVRLFTAVPVEDFLAFAAGTVMLGAGAVLAGVGLLIMGAGMIGLGIGLLLVSTAKLQAVGDILMGMGAIGETGVNFSEVAGGIEAIADAAVQIDAGTLETLQNMAAMTPQFNALASSIAGVATSFSSLAAAMQSIAQGQAEGVASAMERTADALNEIPTVKTVLITAGFGAMGLAATSMVPLALALGAGNMIGDKLDRAMGGTTQGGGSDSSSSEPKEILIKLDAEETRRFFEGEIVRTQGRQNRDGLFSRG